MNNGKAGKDLFKLFNNAIFGKTMENLRKRTNFEILTSRKIALKRIARPNFQRATIFREDLVGIHMAKLILVMNRLIQVGFAILDFPKYLMYDFHYNTWMKKFPNLTLLFTDADSLAYEVELLLNYPFPKVAEMTDYHFYKQPSHGHDLYAGMGEIKDECGFSEDPKNHFLQSYDNMKLVGKFKDECKGHLMLRFVGLRPKLNSFDYERETYFDCKDLFLSFMHFFPGAMTTHAEAINSDLQRGLERRLRHTQH